MLDANIIQSLNSKCLSSPAWEQKKDGSVRWCIDYRQLNQKTINDSYLLPNIEDCLYTLSGSIYFCTMDMETGYYLEETADRKKNQHSLPGLDYLSMFVWVWTLQCACHGRMLLHICTMLMSWNAFKDTNWSSMAEMFLVSDNMQVPEQNY